MKIDTLIDQLAHQRRIYGNVDVSTDDGIISRVIYTPTKDGVVNHDGKHNDLHLDFVSE